MDEYASSNSYSVVGRTYLKLYRYRTKPKRKQYIKQVQGSVYLRVAQLMAD